MLITDDKIADSLAVVSPERCKVLAARSFHEIKGRPNLAAYECCACAMPASACDGQCEICGRDNFRAIKETP